MRLLVSFLLLLLVQLCICSFEWVKPSYWTNSSALSKPSAFEREAKELQSKISAFLHHSRGSLDEEKHQEATSLQNLVDSFFKKYPEATAFHEQVSKFFSSTSPFEAATSAMEWGHLQVRKFPHHYLVVAEVPGIPKEKLHVTVGKDLVTIKGMHDICIPKPVISTSAEKEKVKDICIERSIEKAFKIPPDVNYERVEAKIKDGILILIMERTEGFEKEVHIEEYTHGMREMIKEAGEVIREKMKEL